MLKNSLDENLKKHFQKLINENKIRGARYYISQGHVLP